MTDFGGTYTTGAISVANGGTTVTGTGTFWSPVAEQGDWLYCNGYVGLVASVTDNTHLELDLPWSGPDQSTQEYRLLKMSWLRYEPAITQAKVRALLAYFDSVGLFYFVSGDAPDPSLGDDGQFALKVNASPWRLWLKTGGEWVLQNNPIGATSLPLEYVIASSIASDDDKRRANYVCDGVNDQNAIFAAISALGNNNAVIRGRGPFYFSDYAELSGLSNYLFDFEAAIVFGPGSPSARGTKDTIRVTNCTHSRFRMPSILHSSSGDAIRVQKCYDVDFELGELTGTYGSTVTGGVPSEARIGNGFHVDGTTYGSTVCRLRTGWVHGFDKGIYFEGGGGVVGGVEDGYHDTWRIFGTDFVYDCNTCFQDKASTAAGVRKNNTFEMHVNLDAYIDNAVALQIGGQHHRVFLTPGAQAPNPTTTKLLKFDAGASDNVIFDLPSIVDTFGPDYIEDDSGVNSNVWGNGMPISTPQTAKNSIVKVNGSSIRKFDYTGLQFGAVGTPGRLLYVSDALGTIGEIAAPSAAYAARGLIGSNNAASPTTEMDFSAAEVVLFRPSDGHVVLKGATGALTCDTGTAGPAANGRDQSGAFSAGQFIHFYWIYNLSTNTLATICSTSSPSSGPSLPSGYQHWGYIATIYFDGSSHLANCYVRGSWVFATTDVFIGALTTGSSPTNALSLAASVPPIASTVQYFLSTTMTTDSDGVASAAFHFGLVSGVDYLAPQGTTGGVALAPGFTPGGLGGLIWAAPYVNSSIYYGVQLYNGTSPMGTVRVLGYQVPNGA